MPFASAEKEREYHREYRAKHRVAAAAYMKEYYRQNRERLREQQRLYRADPERQAIAVERATNWRLANPEKEAAKGKRYRQRHPSWHREWYHANLARARELGRQSENRRRARKAAVACEAVALDQVFTRDKGMCGICGEAVERGNWHLDHVIPLSKGGPHTYDNVQVAHPACNLSKGDKLLDTERGESNA